MSICSIDRSRHTKYMYVRYMYNVTLYVKSILSPGKLIFSITRTVYYSQLIVMYHVTQYINYPYSEQSRYPMTWE